MTNTPAPMQTNHAPTPLQAAISGATFVPVQQVTVKNWHVPLPSGQFYATPQDRVLELIKQAETLRNSHAALQAENERLRAALDRSLSWLSSYPGGNAEGAYNQARAALLRSQGEK